MTDDPVKQAIVELQDLVRCRCLPAYTVRKLRDPECDCDSAENVKVVVDRIEALTEQLEAARLDAKEAEAYALWLEGKLQKTEKALDKIAGKAPYADDPYDIARAALAELKGDKT